ncbi:hypothetical protein SEVIR_7G037916v4 [Setaria viridis]|uniref:Uncharacterized protein n=1 Tax=Setaria viridis TaxID=4556 RepID=A0A4U6TQA1_SETVI|nr:hypothetical protein SEVIR_7G037916v2 [Setaria viridis]
MEPTPRVTEGRPLRVLRSRASRPALRSSACSHYAAAAARNQIIILTRPASPPPPPPTAVVLSSARSPCTADDDRPPPRHGLPAHPAPPARPPLLAGDTAPTSQCFIQAIVDLKKGEHLLKCGKRGKPKFCAFRLSSLLQVFLHGVFFTKKFSEVNLVYN